jgi:hypothetical protein
LTEEPKEEEEEVEEEGVEAAEVEDEAAVEAMWLDRLARRKLKQQGETRRHTRALAQITTGGMLERKRWLEVVLPAEAYLLTSLSMRYCAEAPPRTFRLWTRYVRSG